jgi:hypothetical protein
MDLQDLQDLEDRVDLAALASESGLFSWAYAEHRLNGYDHVDAVHLALAVFLDDEDGDR